MAEPRLPPEEVAASLRASRDLGPDYDDAIAAALAERLNRTIDECVRSHVAERTDELAKAQGDHHGARIMVAAVSLIFAIPLSAIAGGTAGAAGLALTWVGIVLVNLLMLVGARR